MGDDKAKELIAPTDGGVLDIVLAPLKQENAALRSRLTEVEGERDEARAEAKEERRVRRRDRVTVECLTRALEAWTCDACQGSGERFKLSGPSEATVATKVTCWDCDGAKLNPIARTALYLTTPGPTRESE